MGTMWTLSEFSWEALVMVDGAPPCALLRNRMQHHGDRCNLP